MVKTDAKSELGAGEAFFSVADLNKYMAQRRAAELAAQRVHEEEEAEARAEQIKQLMIPIEITRARVANFLRRVRSAAEGGEHQILILRFPSDMCTDGGRAINNTLPAWENTLVGVPQQLVQVWQEHLKELGFRLSAEVLDYPRGMPGDIGLFCRW